MRKSIYSLELVKWEFFEVCVLVGEGRQNFAWILDHIKASTVCMMVKCCEI
jgi:hypothetical protein